MGRVLRGLTMDYRPYDPRASNRLAVPFHVVIGTRRSKKRVLTPLFPRHLSIPHLCFPERLKRIVDLERSFGTTIKKSHTVEEIAWKGREFVSDEPEEPGRLVMSSDAFTSDLCFLARGGHRRERTSGAEGRVEAEKIATDVDIMT